MKHLKYFMIIYLLSAIIAVVPAMAQNGSNANITAGDFAPGFLLSPDQKNDLNISDINQEWVFPSSRYTITYTEDELYAFYSSAQYNKTLSGFLNLARMGDGRAQETLGLMYRFGQGIQRNDEQAIRWFLRAAENQRPLAQHHLGSMYFAGQGVNRDLLQSSKWLELAVRNYHEGADRTQALSDRQNVNLRLSRSEQTEAINLAEQFLQDFPIESERDN